MNHSAALSSSSNRIAITPLVLIGAVIALTLGFVVPGQSLGPLLYGIVAGSYALVLNNPVWILAPVMVTHFALSGYIPGTDITVRLAVSVVSAALALPAIVRMFQLRDSKLAYVMVPAIGFFGLVTAANLLHSDAEYAYKYFRYQFTQLVVLFLAASLIRERRDLKCVSCVVLLIALASALSAIWQHFDRHGAPYSILGSEMVGRIDGRSPGLNSSAIQLANDMPSVLLPILGLLAVGPLRFDRTRIALLAAIVMIGLGAYFTYTRSVMYAVAAGIITIGLYLRGPRRILIFAVVVCAAIVFLLSEGTGLIGARYYRGVEDDRSAATHLALWQVGLAMALDNAIVGVGHQDFDDVAVEYESVVDVGSVDEPMVASMEGRHPHNDFLNVWFSWGIFTLAAYLALFAGTFVNLAIAARSPDILVRGLAVGCAGGLATYAVNSAFHNYLDSSPYLFLYAGLSIALTRLTAVPSVTRRVQRVSMLRLGSYSADRPVLPRSRP